MRYNHLLPLLLFTLLSTSCQRWSWGGAADLLIPDELTVGQGSSTIDTTGGYTGHSNMFEYEGEGESSYAALTWDLPSVSDNDGGMSRETQRNLSLLIDQMVEEQVASEDTPDQTLGMNLREGAVAPPAWLPYALGGALIVIILGFTLFSRKRDQW